MYRFGIGKQGHEMCCRMLISRAYRTAGVQDAFVRLELMRCTR